MATVYQLRRPQFRVQEIDTVTPATSGPLWVSSFKAAELARARVANLRYVGYRRGMDGPWSPEAALGFAWNTPSGPVERWVTYPVERLAVEIYTDRFELAWLSDEELQYDYEPVPLL